MARNLPGGRCRTVMLPELCKSIRVGQKRQTSALPGQVGRHLEDVEVLIAQLGELRAACACRRKAIIPR
eukprot:9172923-Prorocentrum_lima.AAC.1